MSSLALRLLAVLVQPPTIIPPVAFVDVTVIPMDRHRRLRHQTVVVDRGRISALGPTGEVTIPTGATVVPGQGRFLIPGLFDMHAHLQSDGRLPDSLAPDELALFLANGVTTVRLMIGTQEHLVLRRELRAGRIQGPDLVIGSPQLAGKAFGDPFNGYAVATPAEAAAAVRRAKADGYDFIKVTFFISRAVYDAIVATAAEVGLRVVGHVDPEVGLARALETGQQIEHLDGFPEALLPDSNRERRSVSGVGVWQARAWETLDRLDLSRIDSVARSAATRGLFVTPTLTFLRTAFGDGQTDAEIAARPDFRFFPEYLKTEMAGPRAAFWKHPPDPSRRRRYVEVRNRVTAALARAGARIMAGSDAPEWFLGNGWTLHRELASLVAAGLTPYQALAVGKRAALVLPGDASDESTALNRMGNIFFGFGRVDSALTSYRQVRAVRRRVGDRRGEGNVLNNIGYAFAQLGESDSALATFREAKKILQTAGTPGEVAAVDNGIAGVFSVRGQPDSTTKYLAMARETYRDLGDRTSEARVLTNLGLTFRGMGQFDSALTYLTVSLQSKSAGPTPDPRDLGTTNQNIGLVYADLGRSDSALAFYHTALGFARRAGEDRLAGQTLSNIGVVYLDIGLPDSALKYYAEATVVAERIGDRPGLAAASANLGAVFWARNQLDSALHRYSAARVAFHELGDRGKEGVALANIADMLLQMRRSDSARKHALGALSMAREIGDPRLGALAHRLIAETYHRGTPPDLARALAYYDSAATERSRLRVASGGDGN